MQGRFSDQFSGLTIISVCELGRISRMACPDWPSMQEREPQMMKSEIVWLIIPTRCIMGRWAQPYGTVMFLNAVSPLWSKKKKEKKWFDVCNSSQFSKSVCVTCAKVCTYCVFWIKKECPPSCHNLSVLAWDSRSCQKEGVCAWFMQLNFTTKIYKSRVRGYERVKAGIKVNSR